MSALLEVPAIRQRVARISVADYHRLGELPVELLRGTLIEKVSKSPLHYSFVEKLREILAPLIKPGWVLRQEGPLTLADSEPEPDLCVARGNKMDFYHTHPNTAELVIEVAVSSLEIDRVKAQIYAEADVKECWIVLPEENRVEVYRQPGASGYNECFSVAAPIILESAALPGVRVDLTTLFSPGSI